jgi:hypothetical protein
MYERSLFCRPQQVSEDRDESINDNHIFFDNDGVYSKYNAHKMITEEINNESVFTAS